MIGPYESAYRYEEPREKEDELLSLELKADLGFAELVSATGYSQFDAIGQRDQTDLLIRLDYSYEEFPAFSAYTEEVDERKILTQELRLVSQAEGPLSWIAGFYYNKTEYDGYSKEFTPGFDEYAIDVWEVGGNYRPDSLEYYSVSNTETTESAFYGEVSYEVNEKLNVTLGMRAYQYDIESASAIDLPLYYSVFEGRGEDSIELDYSSAPADDSGTLFKFNASYQFDDNTMGYVTISEGFRIGGANGVGACPSDIDDIATQIVCALPDEQNYEPDTTTNYELGLKSSYFKNRLQLNLALFNVDWDDAQVGGATINGQQPITTNAEGANSRGAEISVRALATDNITLYATYSKTIARLTADAPFLFGVFGEQGSALQDYYDGKDGDRLPGSPEQQFSFGVNYATEVLDGKMLDLNYGLTAQDDVFSTVGLRQNGEALPGYAVSNFNAKLSDDVWSVTFYIDNLFDKYAYTSVRRDRGDMGLATFASMTPNGTELLRNYGHYVLTPRTVGLKFNYQFEL